MKPLALDYAFAYSSVAEFFAGDPTDPTAWRRAIERAQQHPRDRMAIAAIIAAQQQRREAPPEAVAALAQLRADNGVAIVTGQQAGLFGGPLYTLLKAVTALQLAERIRTEYRVPAAAIFWIDAEDHDWDEVRGAHVLDGEMKPHALRVGDPPGANSQPVARVRLDESIDTALSELERVLPQTPFTGELLGSLRQAYRTGVGMSDAFGRWLERVLGPHGLVVYDAADPAAKTLASPVFQHEIATGGTTARLAAETGAALERKGYHAQVQAQDGNLAIFDLEGGRESLTRADGGFTSGDQFHTQSDLLQRVSNRPEAFSPNVLLRPVVQDTIFPTVAYVAGPSELAYLGQLGRVYESFGVPMPLVVPRATATLVDSNAMRFLSRHELALEALRAQDESALNALLEAQLPPAVEATLQDAVRAVEERMSAVAAAVTQIDPTLEGATRSTLGRMQDDLKKLHGKIIQATKRKDETLRRQFTHARAQAFPNGQQQERAIAFVYFLNQYGPTLVDRLRESLTPEPGTHWVLSL